MDSSSPRRAGTYARVIRFATDARNSACEYDYSFDEHMHFCLPLGTAVLLLSDNLGNTEAKERLPLQVISQKGNFLLSLPVPMLEQSVTLKRKIIRCSGETWFARFCLSLRR